MYELYLAHHGILGQRWGVRRFQNKDGSLTNAGEKRYSGQARHKPSSARKQAKQRAAALEKARKAKAEKAEFEKAKQKALTGGNATDVLKFQGHLTQKEMQDAFNRINLERQLKEISVKETAKGKSTVAKIFDGLSKGVDYGNKIFSAYQLINKFKSQSEASSKNSILAQYLKGNGSYDDIVKQKQSMTPGDFEAALQALEKRKKEKK